MFTILQSNHLERLIDGIAESLGEAGSPMTAENVVVQNAGMRRWLSLEVAQRLDVCANVDFKRPWDFIWGVLRRTVPSRPESSPYASEPLVWRTMALLGDLERKPQFKELNAYLDGQDDGRRFALAHKICETFERYLIYRPDWIVSWEGGEETHWQAELWRRLASEAGPLHRVHLLQRLREAARSGRLGAELPDRISVFGIPSLPPSYLEAFHLFSKACEVRLYVLNPCREYWGDIVSERTIAKKEIEADTRRLHIESGNPLLASLGRQGRDFLDSLLEWADVAKDDYAANQEDNLLHRLQNDILDLRDRGRQDNPKTELAQHDRSIQIHSCHGAMREVEVLQDRLLALFEENPDLRPSDVVVMTPDLETYAPFFEAVFGSVESRRRFPFHVADRTVASDGPLIRTFFRLLELPGGRFDSSQVLGLLEAAAVRRRFEIREDDLPTLQRWVRDSGIRWGIDPENRSELNLPATADNTWKQGLDRLLLGYALPTGGGELFESILPYDDVEGRETRTLGRFIDFVEEIFALRSRLAPARSPRTWDRELKALLGRLFEPRGQAEENEIQEIRKSLQALRSSSAEARFDRPVTLQVVRSYLQKSLSRPSFSGRFLAGGVTFCALVPMRCIPFQVVCLVGMNDRDFPRNHRRPSFDLMANDFRRGDYLRRDQDRYLFLESILSARLCLYVSYTGQGIRDNNRIPPSIVVSDLLRYLEGAVQVSASEPEASVASRIVTTHPLQPFSRRYFEPGHPGLFSYSGQMRRAAGHAEKARAPSEYLVSEPLPPPPDDLFETLELERLIRFLAHPVRFFIKNRLGIILEEVRKLPESKEPFRLRPLERYKIRQQMLSLLERGREAEVHGLIRAAGSLPHGKVGDALLERERLQVERFVQDVAGVIPTRSEEQLAVTIELAGLRLVGRLEGISPGGLVDMRLARVQAKDVLNIWVRHLVLNLVAPVDVEPVSLWVGDDRRVSLRPVPSPREHLQLLADVYLKGLRESIHLFSNSSFAYVNALRNPRRSDALWAARKEWEGSDSQWGEGMDAYHRFAFRGRDPLDRAFRDLARAVFEPVLDHLGE